MKKLKPNNTKDNKGREKKTTKESRDSDKKQTATKEESTKKRIADRDVMKGSCLDLEGAGSIVLAAAGGGHGINEKLGDFLPSPDLRLVFQEDVFSRIKKAGCDICKIEIPNGADKTLKDVMIAIQQESFN